LMGESELLVEAIRLAPPAVEPYRLLAERLRVPRDRLDIASRNLNNQGETALPSTNAGDGSTCVVFLKRLKGRVASIRTRGSRSAPAGRRAAPPDASLQQELASLKRCIVIADRGVNELGDSCVATRTSSSRTLKTFRTLQSRRWRASHRTLYRTRLRKREASCVLSLPLRSFPRCSTATEVLVVHWKRCAPRRTTTATW
jgi:hypothetical protein